MKIVAIAAVATLALGSAAYAGGHSQSEARAMADVLKTVGGGNNSPLKEALNLEGNGGVASFVSGGGNGGWGNVGSTLTGEPGVAVSNRQAKGQNK